jgi:hypothetical protein
MRGGTRRPAVPGVLLKADPKGRPEFGVRCLRDGRNGRYL